MTAMTRRLLWLLSLAVLAGAAARAASPTEEPKSEPTAEAKADPKAATKVAPGEKWEAAIAKFEETDRKAPPSVGGVVFFGSSSIVRWKLAESFPDQGYINRGFGGSQMSDAARYVGRAVIPLKPRLLVVYSGDNDLGANKTPEQVRESALALADSVHKALPETRIVFIGVKASIKRWSLIEKIRATNKLLAEMCAADARRAYVEVADKMLGSDGKPRPELFVADELHLSPEGYKLWNELLRPHLEPKP